MIAAGARLVLGTDAGIEPPRVRLGGPPRDGALGRARTDAGAGDRGGDLRPAELLGLKDMGTLASGKSADFMVLDANPLDDIRNTRQIASVFLHGSARIETRWPQSSSRLRFFTSGRLAGLLLLTLSEADEAESPDPKCGATVDREAPRRMARSTEAVR